MKTDDIIKTAFDVKRNEEYWKYKRMERTLDEHQTELEQLVTKVLTEGIVLIPYYVAENIKAIVDIDLFKLLEATLKQRGRDYIRCESTNRGRILMSLSARPYIASITTNLMLVAEKRDGKYEPDWTKWSAGAVQVWVSVRKITFFFQEDEGKKVFEEWREFVINDPSSKARLGIN